MYCYVKNSHTSMDKVMICIYEENNKKYFMCIVMLRILNLSYINGKSNDLYLRRNQQEIRSTIISFFYRLLPLWRKLCNHDLAIEFNFTSAEKK